MLNLIDDLCHLVSCDVLCSVNILQPQYNAGILQWNKLLINLPWNWLPWGRFSHVQLQEVNFNFIWKATVNTRTITSVQHLCKLILYCISIVYILNSYWCSLFHQLKSDFLVSSTTLHSHLLSFFEDCMCPKTNSFTFWKGPQQTYHHRFSAVSKCSILNGLSSPLVSHSSVHHYCKSLLVSKFIVTLIPLMWGIQLHNQAVFVIYTHVQLLSWCKERATMCRQDVTYLCKLHACNLPMGLAPKMYYGPSYVFSGPYFIFICSPGPWCRHSP